jgi:cell wall-associated NlpC family hydrolase
VAFGPIALAETTTATTTTTQATPTAASGHAKKGSWAERKKVALKALHYAKREEGKPYSWGAAGPNAFDCSGLTSWSYRKAGVELPRTAHEQHLAVKEKISWKHLYPGDLVFFDDDGHVGIVSKRVGHKIYMINAPHAGDHVRQVVLDAYRKSTFSGAVRPY